MAKLILTDEEKKANLWSDLDNESLGMIVKKTISQIKKASDQLNKIFIISAGIILCSAAAGANADKLTQEIDNLTSEGKPLGDWIIVVKRKKEVSSDRAKRLTGASAKRR